MFEKYYDAIWSDGADLESIMYEIRKDASLTDDEVEYLMEQANCAYEQ